MEISDNAWWKEDALASDDRHDVALDLKRYIPVENSRANSGMYLFYIITIDNLTFIVPTIE